MYFAYCKRHVPSSVVICLKGCSCLAACLCFRGTSVLPEGDRLYRCSYDFLARNHTELSVLQGETLEVQKKCSILSSRHTAATNVIATSSPLQVLESADRWSKCRNRFEEIGCVPSNILEPLSALNAAESSVVYREVPTRLTARRPCMHDFDCPSLLPIENLQSPSCKVFLLCSIQPHWDQLSSYQPSETTEHGSVIHAAGRRWWPR